MSETRTFQAETQQLLNILIHSLYTDKEIFLRELLSNASDALNRLQFEQLTNATILDPEAPLEVRIKTDAENRTLTITDTGIGMTRDEVIENLGTIARSGAKNFIESLQNSPNKDAAQNVIGQFGVGFYSVFMVADKVRVLSRSYKSDAEAVLWEADGGTSYSIDTAEKATRGTEITIYLKEDAKDFIDEWQVKDAIKHHSDYIAFPIYVNETPEPANKQTALWRQSPREVSAEDYEGFYRMLTMDFNKPLHTIHMRADVPMQFYALMFIPSSPEMGMFASRREPGLKLYARKVLIQEYNKDLLPEYLGFVQGIVDSEDLPLSVSRESIKADRIMANLKKTITTKVLSELKRLASNERETYLKIFQAFGRHLKQGLVVTAADRDDLMGLLFFPSTQDNKADMLISLDEYTQRMAQGQSEIYYVIADDFASASRSPHLDAFRQRGIEVLYFSDPVDAMLPMGLTEYKTYKFRSVDDSDIDLKDIGEAKADETPAESVEADQFGSLVERVKSVLGERVKDVKESKVLVGSAARLVNTEAGNQRHMYRINRMLDRDYELPVKTLELNPRHPLLHNLAHMVQSDSNNPLLNVVIEQLFETALLQDGLHPDPAAMAERLTLLMQAATDGNGKSEN